MLGILKSCLAFLRSRIFWMQLAIGLLGIVVLFFALKFGLRQFTRYNDHITVAKVVGLDRAGALAMLESQGLEPILLDSIYDPRGRAGAVVDQDPRPLAQVKSGRKVYLTVYRSGAPSERIEVTEGMDAQVARIILRNKGFGFVEQYVSTTDLAGLIVEVRRRGKVLLADDRAPRGAELELHIGISKQQMVELPDFSGVLLRDAVSRIEALGLKLGRVKYASADSADAVVLSQQPPFVQGRRIALNALIDLSAKGAQVHEVRQ
jgi:beta-lactam-binding protein with PASTA domain